MGVHWCLPCGAVRGCALKPGAGKADSWRGPMMALGMGQRGWDWGAPWPAMPLRKHGLPRTRGATVEGCTRAGAAHAPAPPPSVPGAVRTSATPPQSVARPAGLPPVVAALSFSALLRCAQPVSACPASHSGGTRYPSVASKPKLSTRAEAAKEEEWKSLHVAAKAGG